MLALVAAVALLLGSSCSLLEREDELSEMTLERRGREGTINLTREGDTVEVGDGAAIETGDVIATSGGAQARLRLSGDRVVWLADATTIDVIDTNAVGNERGTVLADAGDPTTVTFGEIAATAARAVFRVDRQTASVRAGVYRGSVNVDAPGQERIRVRTYFQASGAAGAIGNLAPYSLSVTDGWDRLWLDEVVALDEELNQLAGGFSSQIGRARPDLSFFQRLSGGREVAALRPYLARRPADLMIAYSLADAAGSPSFGPSLRRAFGLHDAGAAWGLAATIMEVRHGPLVAVLERLIVGSGAVAGGASDGFPLAPSGAAGPAGGSAPADSGTGDSPADGGGGGDPDGPGDGGGGGDGPADGGGEDDGCANVVDCVIQNPPSPLPEITPGGSLIDGGSP